MSKKREGNLQSVEVTVLDRVTTVYIRGNVLKLMEQYDLTDAMLRYLAQAYGHHPIANIRMEKALIQRGLRRFVVANGEEYYTYTPQGRSLCEKLFYKVTPVPAQRY